MGRTATDSVTLVAQRLREAQSVYSALGAEFAQLVSRAADLAITALKRPGGFS